MVNKDRGHKSIGRNVAGVSLYKLAPAVEAHRGELGRLASDRNKNRGIGSQQH